MIILEQDIYYNKYLTILKAKHIFQIIIQ